MERIGKRHEGIELPRLAGACAMAAAALTLYARTLAPTITWRNNGADSGDLVTAAINLGVPHPSGYPLYTLLAHLFTALPGADPARRVNLLSALAAALAIGILFWTSYGLLRNQQRRGSVAFVAAWLASGLFASGELLWSQATIAEVYGLNLLLVAALLAVALAGAARARPYLLAALFGLGLAHHLTIVLLVPALWPYAGAIRRWLTWQRALRCGLCLLPGLLFYLYIPLRAATHPTPNWGQANSAEGLAWLVSGHAYRHYLGAAPPAQSLQRLPVWAGIWLRDLGILGLALAILGLEQGMATDRRFTWFGLTYLGLATAYAMLYVSQDSYLYLLPAGLIVALWVARGAGLALREVGRWAAMVPSHRWAGPAAAAVLLALPVASAFSRWPAMDLSRDRAAYVFAQEVLDGALPGAVIISDGDQQTFSLWYLRYGLRKSTGVTIVDRNLLAFDWYRNELAAQQPALFAGQQAADAEEALAILLHGGGARYPLYLTYADSSLLGRAQWRAQGPLFALVQP